MNRKLLLLALSPFLLGFQTTRQPVSHFDGESWWNYVKVLAADDMEGRETGSPGLRRAEAYVVEQLTKDGLEPAGANGFYQPVRLESRQIVEKDSRLSLVTKDHHTINLTLGEDAIFNTRVDLASSLKASLVFIGYGLSVPEKAYDDLAGQDLNGKVAVVFSGTPAGIPGALASHYQSPSERWKALKRAGAIGIITIPNPAAMDIPWSRISLNRTHPSMALVGKDFDETAGEKLAVTFNPAHADRLFAGSGHTFEEILDLARARQPLPRFQLAVSIKARAHVDKKNLDSANIVAMLPGTDPKLKNEYVALSAHIDHLGIGEYIGGDHIYNGAMDNASGSALLLDVARSLARPQERLQRSVLFLFFTGEEKGLLGSRYFTSHPTVKSDSIIADVNVDMFLPIIPLKVLTVYGLAESDLGDTVSQVAGSLNVPSQPDPEPQRNSFIRSDQYNFIRHGIPALAMKVGFTSGSPEQKTFKDWLTTRYHAPSDDLEQPVDLESAATFEEIIRGLVIKVAQADGRPKWKPDSFFRRYAPASGTF